jgi:FKBP-type peptidyl-prolyl cis-trans isomerase FkpA
MKIKIVNNVILITILTLIFSSCLKNEDEKEYTAAEEIQLREAYLDALIQNGKDIDTTASGVYYVVREEGEGSFAQSGDTLTVAYAGYFIDGTLFDASQYHYEDGKYEFVLDVSSLIQGWNDGMKVMNEGSVVEFIIPSELAYGYKGERGVPPYQTLLFVIELFDIKSPQN